MDNDNLLTNMRMRLPTLSKKQKKIANTVLEHYDKAVFLTAARLGELSEVSESTVVRFAMEMGYEGYPEFQRALEELVKTELTAIQRMEATYSKVEKGNQHLLKTVMDNDRSRIERTLLEIDYEEFDRVVDAILNARKVYIIGSRSSYSLASFFSFYLGLMLENVVQVTMSNTRESFEQLMDAGENDLCICLSFPRYYKKTIQAFEYAKLRNIQTVAITDTKQSPIAKMADYKLIAQTDMMSLVDTLVAPMSLVNAMLVAISLKDKERILNRFNTLEHLWAFYDSYEKGRTNE